MSPRGWLGALLVLALALVTGGACDSSVACEEATPEVVLGTGVGEFAPLNDGDEVELVHGFQGGFHTVMGLQVRGLGEGPTIEMFGEIDGQRLAAETFVVDGTCDSAGLELTELWLIWASTPEELHRAKAEVSVRVTAADGTQATAEATIIIDDPWIEG